MAVSDENIFGKKIENIKSLVVISGNAALQDGYMLQSLNLTAEQLAHLSKILKDKNHPWMREHEERLNSFLESNSYNTEKSSISEKIKLTLFAIIVVISCWALLGII